MNLITPPPRAPSLDWGRDGPHWPGAHQSRFVDAAGVRWHVREAAGPTAQAPLALLIHGAGGAGVTFDPLIAVLAAHFQILAPDLPGHGFSGAAGASRMSTTALSAALARLLEHMGASPSLVIGHSAGSALLGRMLLDGQLEPRLFVGLGAALKPLPGAAGVVGPAMAKMLTLNPAAPWLLSAAALNSTAADGLLRAVEPNPSAAQRRIYARLLSSPGHVAGTLALLAAWDPGPVWTALPSLETPLLLLHGGADGAIPSREASLAAERAPLARAEILPGLGHLAHELRPDLIGARIVAGFSQVGEAGGALRWTT